MMRGRNAAALQESSPPPMRTDDLDFDLPPELIAQSPPAERAASRLTHYPRARPARAPRTLSRPAPPGRARGVAPDALPARRPRARPPHVLGPARTAAAGRPPRLQRRAGR